MTLVTRTTKAGGGQSYNPNEPLSAAELEEIGTLFALVNGQLTDENVRVSAQVAIEKLAGSILPTSTISPGNTAVPAPAGNLEQEIAFLRYLIKRMNGVNTRWVNAAGANAVVSQLEHPIIGRNLLRNSSFELVDSAAANLPQGWTLVGGPTLTQQATTATEGDGFELNIAANAGAQEGVSQVVTGIRDGAYYLIGCRYKVNSGSFDLETVNAVSGVDYQNLSGIVSTSGTYADAAGIVKATTGANAITVRLVTGGLITDDVDIDHAYMYELGATPATQSTLVNVYKGVASEQPVTVNATISGLSQSVTPPAHNYMIRVRADVTWCPDSTTETDIGIQLLENAVSKRVVPDSANAGTGLDSCRTVSLEYTNYTPVAGTVYAYTLSALHTGQNFTLHPDNTKPLGVQLVSHLSVDLIPI